MPWSDGVPETGHGSSLCGTTCGTSGSEGSEGSERERLLRIMFTHPALLGCSELFSVFFIRGWARDKVQQSQLGIGKGTGVSGVKQQMTN